jgi:hypothetical protein
VHVSIFRGCEDYGLHKDPRGMFPESIWCVVPMCHGCVAAMAFRLQSVREDSQLWAKKTGTEQEICGVPRFHSNTSLFLLVLVRKPLELGTKSLVSYFWANNSWYSFLMRRFLNGRNQL